jgi:hypothetical protein
MYREKLMKKWGQSMDFPLFILPQWEEPVKILKSIVAQKS